MHDQRRSGQIGEQVAASYLKQHGYQIKQTNYRALRGEIDIIARDEGVLCFVEVRSRSEDSCGSPSETVNAAKQQRLIRAAEQYLADNDTSDDVRFDVVSVVYNPDLQIELIKSAYESPWNW